MLHPSLPTFEPGTVWLAGAGPGDPGLLTLLAAHGLQQADAIVYDALVDDRILAMADPGADRIYAGKRGGKPSPKQRDISSRLIELARSGKRVLRLKGGDPFVFGRGAEEALALVGAGIRFRIVPGVTAGIGGLAYAGIPVTHRSTNSAVLFITAHDLTGAVPDALDWDAMARVPVLVIYMVMKQLQEVSARLIHNGRRPGETVAIVESAATPQQRVVESSLANVAADAARAGAKPPAILVVGEVARLRPGLDWLGALEGRVLIDDPLATTRLAS